MSNSKLVSYTRLSPNHSGKRTHKIDRITPHCVVGQCSVETLGAVFAPVTRQASCNYAIGYDGRIALIVDEGRRSWCSSSNANDQRAVTIEVASDLYEPYAMNKKAYNALVDLCVDICKRNGKTKLLWLKTQAKALSYEPKNDEMVLTVHRWFANKSCPGDWLFARLDDLADTVTAKLGGKCNYRVKIVKKVAVRKKAKKTSKKVGVLNKGEVYTIIQKSANKKWGKLKSGLGWIALGYTEKVK